MTGDSWLDFGDGDTEFKKRILHRRIGRIVRILHFGTSYVCRRAETTNSALLPYLQTPFDDAPRLQVLSHCHVVIVIIQKTEELHANERNSSQICTHTLYTSFSLYLVSEMTYTVSSGTLNSSIPFSLYLFIFTLRASCGAVYCNRSCLFVCLLVCVLGWVCYYDNSKLRASILTKLGL